MIGAPLKSNALITINLTLNDIVRLVYRRLLHSMSMINFHLIKITIFQLKEIVCPDKMRLFLFKNQKKTDNFLRKQLKNYLLNKKKMEKK